MYALLMKASSWARKEDKSRVRMYVCSADEG